MCTREGDLITIHETAELLGTTHLKVLLLFRQGKLKGEEQNGEWLLSKGSVLDLKTRGWEDGEATSCRTGCSPSCRCSGR